MEAVETVVLSEALQDEVVYPYQSEQFGGYAWASTKANPKTLNFTEGDSYQGDLLGLRTRAQTNPASLVLSSFEGGHIRFSDQYWNSVIIPFLK
jgi:hypothetical protein